MQKISRTVIALMVLVSMGMSAAYAQEKETLTYTVTEARLADAPSKYGFKGLYTLFSPDTAQKGQYGLGFYWDMTRFASPGDPRYPEVMEFTLGGYYGITDKLEVAVSAPFRSMKLPERDGNRFPDDPAFDEISESGFSNLGLGLRYNVLPTVTPYIMAYLPTASDPESGIGADNTRIHFGVSAGTVVGGEDRPIRLYGQAAYQFATDYDQDRRDFMETPPYVEPEMRPRFEYFGTNPLYQEYGNTLFYGAGFAVPVMTEDRLDFFTEFMFYHSFEDADYIPMFEDFPERNVYDEPLDVVQDGGMANIGLRAGFGNGLALTGGWGGILFAEEPMYNSPHWRAFAGLTYSKPIITESGYVVPTPGEEDGKAQLRPEDSAYRPPRKEPDEYVIDCAQVLMVNFEFDKSSLTPQAQRQLDYIGKYLRICTAAKVEVQGHTDWIGTENYNYGLGNRRARAAVYYLVYDQGIDPARIVSADKLAKGIIAGETYGETQPIASNETDAGRAQNRRAQIVTLN